MTVTTVPVAQPDATVPSWLRHHLGWLLVGAAVVATAVLATLVVTADSSTTVPATGRSTFDADRGSITAIDHRAEAGMASSAVLPESITAIDHRAAAGVTSSAVLPESITAIDHRAESGTTSSAVLPETITAIDHRAETDGR